MDVDWLSSGPTTLIMTFNADDTIAFDSPMAPQTK
jgi:hypothetical protein